MTEHNGLPPVGAREQLGPDQTAPNGSDAAVPSPATQTPPHSLPTTFAAPPPNIGEITNPFFAFSVLSPALLENLANGLHSRAVDEFSRGDFARAFISAGEAVDAWARLARTTREPGVLAHLQNKAIVSAELAAVAQAATGAIPAALQRFSVSVHGDTRSNVPGIFQTQPERQIRAWHRLARVAMAYRMIDLANGAYYWALGVAYHNRAYVSQDYILTDQATRFFAIGYDNEALAVLSNLQGLRQRVAIPMKDAATADRLIELVGEISSILPASSFSKIPTAANIERLVVIAREIYSRGLYQFAAEVLARLAVFEASSGLPGAPDVIQKALSVFEVVLTNANAVNDAPTVAEIKARQAQLRGLLWQAPIPPQIISATLAPDVLPPPKTPGPIDAGRDVSQRLSGQDARKKISALLESARGRVFKGELQRAFEDYQQAKGLVKDQGANIQRVVLEPAVGAFLSFAKKEGVAPDQARLARELAGRLCDGKLDVIVGNGHLQTPAQTPRPSPAPEPKTPSKPNNPVVPPPRPGTPLNPGVREVYVTTGQSFLEKKFFHQAMYRFTVEAEELIRRGDSAGAISSMVKSVMAAIYADVNAEPVTQSVGRMTSNFVRFVETYFASNERLQTAAIEALREMFHSPPIQAVLNANRQRYDLRPAFKILAQFAEAKTRAPKVTPPKIPPIAAGGGPVIAGAIIVPDPDEETAAAQACAAGILPGCEAQQAGTGAEGSESGGTTSPAGRPAPVVPPTRAPR